MAYRSEGHRQIDGFSDRARAKLRGYHWPGNVRELENAVERAVVLCEEPVIDEEYLSFDSGAAARVDGISFPGTTMAELEKMAILRTLEALDGSTVRAAEALDISIRTIQYRLHQYGLAKERGRAPDGPSSSK